MLITSTVHYKEQKLIQPMVLGTGMWCAYWNVVFRGLHMMKAFMLVERLQCPKVGKMHHLTRTYMCHPEWLSSQSSSQVLHSRGLIPLIPTYRAWWLTVGIKFQHSLVIVFIWTIADCQLYRMNLESIFYVIWERQRTPPTLPHLYIDHDCRDVQRMSKLGSCWI